jgi:hypothetical protein
MLVMESGKYGDVEWHRSVLFVKLEGRMGFPFKHFHLFAIQLTAEAEKWHTVNIAWKYFLPDVDGGSEGMEVVSSVLLEAAVQEALRCGRYCRLGGVAVYLFVVADDYRRGDNVFENVLPEFLGYAEEVGYRDVLDCACDAWTARWKEETTGVDIYGQRGCYDRSPANLYVILDYEEYMTSRI